MSLRDPQALLGTFMRAGVLCFAPSARTCIAHGLPEAPDTFSLTPLMGHSSTCFVGIGLESWDATSSVFVNSYASGGTGYLRMAVEFSTVR